MVKDDENIVWSLEIAKVLYALVMTVVLFLFFTLVLDAFCLLAFGNWNALLGKWPIFSGTVNSAFYSPPLPVISLLIAFTAMGRIILGGHTPYILSFLEARNGNGKENDI
ncbi:MAG: hypothetical protein AAF998_09990 [Bacteroidota bacterium]